MVEKNIVKHVLSELFKKLESEGIRYCILHSYETLPDKVKTDVDIAIEKSGLKSIDRILKVIADKNGLKIIQKIHHGYQKYAYILSPTYIHEPFRLQIDFFTDFSVRGYPKLVLNNFMINHRKQYKNFFIPDPKVEFIFSILRRILKKEITPSQISKLKELYLEDISQCRNLLLKYFPEKIVNEISQIIMNKDVDLFKSRNKIYKKQLLIRTLRRNFLFLPSYWISEILRAIKRLRYPVGFTVAFLGPDGAGKSTIAKKVIYLASGSFHGTRIFYWRPELFPQMGELVELRKSKKRKQNLNPRPHDHKIQSPLKSIVRFWYYIVDYILGYYLKVFPLKVRKHLCVFDRYYYDFLVDLFRYNFNIPSWLPRFLLPIIPKPDIVIYLHASPEELYRRKKELPFHELKRQISVYQSILSKLPNAHQINTNKPIDEIVSEIVSLILKKKAGQTLSLLNID